VTVSGAPLCEENESVLSPLRATVHHRDADGRAIVDHPIGLEACPLILPQVNSLLAIVTHHLIARKMTPTVPIVDTRTGPASPTVGPIALDPVALNDRRCSAATDGNAASPTIESAMCGGSVAEDLVGYHQDIIGEVQVNATSHATVPQAGRVADDQVAGDNRSSCPR